MATITFSIRAFIVPGRSSWLFSTQKGVKSVYGSLTNRCRQRGMTSSVPLRGSRGLTQRGRVLRYATMSTVKKGVIRVSGTDFRWSVFRQPTWTRDRAPGPVLLGLAILVEPPESSHRNLLLEFDIDRSRHGDMPQHQRFRLPDSRLITAIQGALQAGYDPDSRGKRFVYEAGALQPR